MRDRERESPREEAERMDALDEDALEVLPFTPSARGNAGASQVYAIRIPTDRLREIRSLAEELGEQPTALLRGWVLERLDREATGSARAKRATGGRASEDGMGYGARRSPLPLGPETIERLSGMYPKGTAELWFEIRALAERFLGSPETDRSHAWHALLFAAGNFKRQGGTVIMPPDLAEADSISEAPDEISVPGVGRVERDGAASWERLEKKVTGLGLATTTTLLSALWPRHHAVMDIRTLGAVCALVRDDPGNPVHDRGAVRPVVSDWTAYDFYRGHLRDTAHAYAREGISLLMVERALFMLTELVPLASGRSWETFARELESHLDAVS